MYNVHESYNHMLAVKHKFFSKQDLKVCNNEVFGGELHSVGDQAIV